jgi:hypothetical protein
VADGNKVLLTRCCGPQEPEEQWGQGPDAVGQLQGRIQQLETSLQERAEQLSHLERQSEKGEWRRGEELRKREDRVRELQLELDRERGKEPLVKVSHDLCELSRAFCVSMLSMNPWMCPSGQKKHLQ